jgi:anaerobic magnesium-protoporphyrin IX monomethyl ester cyclase
MGCIGSRMPTYLWGRTLAPTCCRPVAGAVECCTVRIALVNCRDCHIPLAPLGILYIAAYLRERGHKVRVFDPLPADVSFADEIPRFGPHMVGLGLMTPQYSRARMILRAIRGRLPQANFFAGGPHPSALPRETVRDLALDFAVVGEGEVTVAEAARAIERGAALDSVSGIVYRGVDDGLVWTGPREHIGDLDSLPLPARDLLDQSWYMMPPGFVRGEWLDRPATVIMTRGCPNRCTFCGAKAVHGRRIRRRSVGNALQELIHLKETYGVDGFWVLDDTFTLDPEWVRSLCSAIIANGLRFRWGTQTRVDALDPPTLEALREAGCVQLDFGVESGSSRVLRRLKKAAKPEQVVRAFSLARTAGLRRMASFMVGNPDETMEDLEETLRFAKRISPDYVLVTYTTPYPGTELYEEAKARGWLDPLAPFGRDWNLDNFRRPPVMEASLPREALVAFRRRFQNSFWWTNYSLYLRRPGFVLRGLAVAAHYPGRLLRAFGLLLRTRNVDGFFGDLKALYRLWAWRGSALSREWGEERHPAPPPQDAAAP